MIKEIKSTNKQIEETKLNEIETVGDLLELLSKHSRVPITLWVRKDLFR